MDNLKSKNFKTEMRRKRNRAKIFGAAGKPRLSVFRSNQYIYAQLIDDFKGVTLVSASTRGLKKHGNKSSQAKALGELLAEKAKKAGIKSAVFNKGSYLFHGRVKAVAEGVKAGGLQI